MLYVHFQLGPHRYALDARTVVAVLPLLELQPVPQAPRGIAGLFIYHGQAVPALDLCALTQGRPAHAHLNTRILLLQHPKPAGRVEPCPPRAGSPGFYAAGEPQLIGLIAERVAGTLQREEKDFVNVGVERVTAPFLGPVLMDAQGIIQILDAQKLLAAGSQQLQLTYPLEAEDSRPPRISSDPEPPETQALRGPHLPPPPAPKTHGEPGEVGRGERAT